MAKKLIKRSLIKSEPEKVSLLVNNHSGTIMYFRQSEIMNSKKRKLLTTEEADAIMNEIENQARESQLDLLFGEDEFV